MAAVLSPIDFGRIVALARHIHPTTANAISIHTVCVTNCHGSIPMSAVQHLQPDELAKVKDAFASIAIPTDSERFAAEDFTVGIVLCFDSVDELCESQEPPVRERISVCVDKVFFHRRMINLNPAIRIR